ncbi:heme ABC exporter ATP-binding protein CcmA [Meiothermus taiwanensis]|uniref:Heme exporter protein CcmA n=2 Tax=Meiothermus taiwanensis TaxID=172827 RepID=A0ABN5LZJ1_9DEIN|nr:heme ABC exporter ATP-binding protein CcmA [Meiothermus taiwanensis]AWR87616.1 heme exporter protein CcmA [Meiothermus taiwanensis WR-220]KIQ55094.1 ABC transporter ATP-binding protein [Meiothermus taiwanensis]KZK16727.1 ABC transporter ATP-binding protein [Meiothermus taiwanensis]RIH79280.1 putative ABC transporter ATP-binding protein YxlF [Meiothermus taiwanensis]
MLIEAASVCKRYGRDWVLRNLDFQLAKHEVVALVGPNGVGKTTLLRVLAGLVRPTQGSVKLNGRVGFLANPPAFHRHFTGAENLHYALRLDGKSGSRKEIRAALAQFGLPYDKPVLSYSSGMKKRLAMARLHLQNPDIWLLDEPEAALDAQGRGLLEHLVQQARSRGGVVIATHDKSWLSLVDRVVELQSP